MPRPARTSAPTVPKVGDYLRHLLGFTQQEWGWALGTTAGSVAGNESGRRFLPDAAQNFDLFLVLTSIPLRQAPPVAVPVAPLPLVADARPLPLPRPADLRPDAAAYRLREVAHQALALRFELENRQRQLDVRAQVQAFRRAFLVALEGPPAQAVQYLDSFAADGRAALDKRTARLRADLTDRIQLDDRPGGALDPTTFAFDLLRLSLLDTEAATLAAWLAPPAPG